MILPFDMVREFIRGWRCGSLPQDCSDRDLRNHLSEQQVDKMVRDSFPASDPPSTY